MAGQKLKRLFLAALAGGLLLSAPTRAVSQTCPCWTDEMLQSIAHDTNPNGVACYKQSWWAGDDNQGFNYTLQGVRNNLGEHLGTRGGKYCEYTGTLFPETDKDQMTPSEFQACEDTFLAEIKRRGLTCELY